MDERELQRRMQDAVQGTAPDTARLWENIMDETSHAQKLRNAKRMGIVLTLLAFAVAIPVAMNLASDDDGGLVGPGGSESPSPSPSPTETIAPSTGTPFLHAAMNVMLDVPDGWRTGEFEGHVEISPDGLPGPTEGGDTIYLDLFAGALETPSGAPNDTIGGHDAWMTGGVEWGRTWTVSWPTGLALPGGAAEDGYITISIGDSGNGNLSDEYGAAVLAMVDSIREPADVAGGEMQTRFGSMTGITTIDDLTLTAAAFMDERIFGDPTILLTAEAMQQYEDLGELPGGDPWLTALGNGYFQEYTITERRDADANSAEFDLEITYVVDSDTYTISETIGVGAGANHQGDVLDAVVRFVIGSVA